MSTGQRSTRNRRILDDELVAATAAQLETPRASPQTGTERPFEKQAVALASRVRRYTKPCRAQANEDFDDEDDDISSLADFIDDEALESDEEVDAETEWKRYRQRIRAVEEMEEELEEMEEKLEEMEDDEDDAKQSERSVKDRYEEETQGEAEKPNHRRSRQAMEEEDDDDEEETQQPPRKRSNRIGADKIDAANDDGDWQKGTSAAYLSTHTSRLQKLITKVVNTIFTGEKVGWPLEQRAKLRMFVSLLDAASRLAGMPVDTSDAKSVIARFPASS